MLLMHLGGALLVGWLPMVWPLKVLLWTALAVSAALTSRQHISRTSPRAITALELDQEGVCSVQCGLTGPWEVCERFQAVVTPWIVIFLLRYHGRHWPAGLVIAADAVESEPFRRLRARLRLQTRVV